MGYKSHPNSICKHPLKNKKVLLKSSTTKTGFEESLKHFSLKECVKL